MNLVEWGLMMMQTNVSCNSQFYSEHQAICSRGLRSVTRVKFSWMQAVHNHKENTVFYRCTWVTTAEVNSSLHFRGAQNTFQEQFHVFEETKVPRLLFSWRFLTHTQVSHRTPFLDCVPITPLYVFPLKNCSWSWSGLFLHFSHNTLGIVIDIINDNFYSFYFICF